MALMALALTIEPVFAAAPSAGASQDAKTFGFSCVNGFCRAQLDLGIGANLLPQGVWLTVLERALRVLPDRAGVGVQNDVTLTLPTGTLSLADADMVLTMDEAGKIMSLR